MRFYKLAGISNKGKRKQPDKAYGRGEEGGLFPSGFEQFFIQWRTDPEMRFVFQFFHTASGMYIVS